MTSKTDDIIKYFPQYSNDPEKIKELQEYQKDLNILAESDISIQFNNKGKDHAMMVMSKIFECAHSEIKIFAKDFNGAISDNTLYIEKLKNFLDKEKENKVHVIFESAPNKNSKALELLKSIRDIDSSKVILRKASNNQIKEFQNYLVNSEKMIHFTIGDDPLKGFNKYRCETDINNYIAILNFDDPKFSSQLLKLHRVLDKNATEIA